MFTAWQNRHVFITRYSIITNKSTESLRIAQLSDFHNSHGLGNETLKKTEAEEPDIIVLTGDFVDGSRTDTAYALSIAKKLTAIAPTYFITGNHEARISDYIKFERSLKDTGVVVLRNDFVDISESTRLTGIDDPLFDWDPDVDSTANVAYTLSKLEVNTTKYNILLSHRAEAFSAYKQYDLILTGHAHGGQFRLPFIGGLIAPDQGLFPKYDAGQYKSGEATMIVSRGIGNSLIPVRINNPPEITIIDINMEE